ncbi:MAG: hypothetical protein GC146_14855 [Limimaricola sp.]|uniref:DUF5337 domain-containing protein n=1 Tax=Limimaricola sp. TaxID=2211665 RepID=UPI001DA6CA22|nr:DUF5337 domain-containing protein [Limimaricola sp.]MBI1418495.1 hypothetical protein [Limimaricola sp.]
MTDTSTARAGRRAALVMAGVGLFWIAATAIGGWLGLDNRTRALFDLIALAGFIWALWLTYQLWRARRNDED